MLKPNEVPFYFELLNHNILISYSWAFSTLRPISSK